MASQIKERMQSQPTAGPGKQTIKPGQGKSLESKGKGCC